MLWVSTQEVLLTLYHAHGTVYTCPLGSYCPHDKFIWIMTTEDMGTLNQLGEFIINCFLLRKA